MATRNRMRGLAFAAAVLACTALAYRSRQQAAEQTGPYGRYTAEQVLGFATRLSHEIAPEAGGLRLTVNRTQSGVTTPLWEVVGIDDRGRDIVSLQWDARTGDLMSAGHLLRNSTRSLTRTLTRREATRVAWKWLQTLGIAYAASSWQLTQPPRRVRSVWAMVWQTAERRAYITVDIYTGALIQMVHTRLQTVS